MSRAERIQSIVLAHLAPLYMHVDDESPQHHNLQSHFKVTVVSAKFTELSRLDRHRWLNQLLSLEFVNGLHALSLHLYTPVEWEARSNMIPLSPACRGGGKNNHKIHGNDTNGGS